jgi:hypothetical protein
MGLILLEDRGLLPLPANVTEVSGWAPNSSPQLTAIESRAQFVLYGGASGGGKMLDMDTPIPTPNGWTTMRDLRVGDTIFDDTGAQCKVTHVFDPVIGDSYCITFDDGSKIVSDAQHPWYTMTGRERSEAARLTPEWRAKRRAKRPSRAIADPKKPWVQTSVSEVNRNRVYNYKDAPTGGIRTTAEIRDTLIGIRRENNHSIAVAGPLRYEEKSLPIHPYVFGCWLGDGTSAGGGYTCNDPEIIGRLRRCAVPEIYIAPGHCKCGCGSETSISPRDNGSRGHRKGQHVPYLAGHGNRSTKNRAVYKVKKSESDPLHYQIHGISHLLLFMGTLNNKHIPRQYLEASIEQRMELLRGLMDTDGMAGADGTCIFTSTNKDLAHGAFELALSLGIKATLRPGVAKLKGRIVSDKYDVAFITAQSVFHLSRKAQRQKPKVRDTVTRRYVVSVEKVLDRPMRCISVDAPSRLYLCGRQMIPTHNSNWLVADSAQEYDNPRFRGILLRKSFTEMTNIMDEMERIYSPLGGRKSEGGKLWKFPSGAMMRLGYMASDKHVELYTGKPISWLGIDEAQFQTEERVRSLLPWVSTPTEYGLRDRVRLTANPSTPWLRHVFLNSECPVCHPERCVKPAAVYAGATWKKDLMPVMMTTAFIPALLKDNPAYDERKLAMLMSQTADIQKKLIAGCWCHTEGAFFPFLNESYILPYSECREEWWHLHLIVMDYGMSGSAAATGLYFLNEANRMFKIGEDIERKMYSSDYAPHIAKKFLEREIGGKRTRIITGYCDPAMDAHTGTGKSNREIIQEVFDQYGLTLMSAAKDSIGNAQSLAGRLTRGEFVYTDLTPNSFEAAVSRKHDPDRPGAILKIKGDELDDCIDCDLYTNTWLTGDRKPDEIVTEEKIQALIAAGVDQRSIMVTRHRMERENEKKGAPITMGRPSLNRAQIHR